MLLFPQNTILDINLFCPFLYFFFLKNDHFRPKFTVFGHFTAVGGQENCDYLPTGDSEIVEPSVNYDCFGFVAPILGLIGLFLHSPQRPPHASPIWPRHGAPQPPKNI